MWPGAPEVLEQTIAATAIGAARTIPITWLVPGIGGRHVPAPVRIGLGVALALLALPALLAARHAIGVPEPPLAMILLVGREILVGTTVGLVASFAFRAAEAAGRLTDVLRGSNMAEVLSPASEERTSPLGDVSLLLAVLIFFEIGGVDHLVLAIARSYQAMPPLLGGAPSGRWKAAEVVTAASAKLIESAVGLAAPVIVSFLLAELALGAIARAAPQIPVYFAAMPLRALLGVGVVLLGLAGLSAAIAGGFPGWMALVRAAFRAWR